MVGMKQAPIPAKADADRLLARLDASIRDGERQQSNSVTKTSPDAKVEVFKRAPQRKKENRGAGSPKAPDEEGR